jgi:hypothetical protein
LLALARVALERYGVASPAAHIMMVVNTGSGSGLDTVPGNATILVGLDPFTPAEVARIYEVAERLDFRVAVAPGHREDVPEIFWTVATGEGLAELERQWPFRLDAPTDDQPFFFNMLRLRRLLNPEVWRVHAETPNLRAVSTLLQLVVAVALLAVAFIVLPLLLAGRTARPLRGDWPLVGYFGAIGMGFMLVEVSQLQRLTLYLGHPTYGLTVVLFGILCASGVGSFLSGRLDLATPRQRAAVIALLVAVLAVIGPLAPRIVRVTEAQGTPLRIAIALGILTPMGLLMGMCFPLGMRAAYPRAQELTPWLWGINGATSVFASVLAVVIAMESGISAAHWVGTGFYALAAVALLRTRRAEAAAEEAGVGETRDEGVVRHPAERMAGV